MFGFWKHLSNTELNVNRRWRSVKNSLLFFTSCCTVTYLNVSFFRDLVTNTSGLSLEQLSGFRKLEEITGTENWEVGGSG